MKTKTVYQADPLGRYIGPTTAYESPLQPGVWLIPAGAYEDAPPATKADSDLVKRVGKSWVVESAQPPTEQQDAPIGDEASSTVPQVVTMRQARLALLAADLLDRVGPAIGALPEAQRRAALIEWEYSTTVSRTSALTAQLAAVLDLDSADLDSLFEVAAAL